MIGSMTQRQVSADADPLKKVSIRDDLVGVLNPVKNILLVSPGYEDQALRSLQAEKQADDSYKIQTVSMQGAPQYATIRVLPAPPQAIFDEHEWLVKYLTERTRADTNAGKVITVSRDSSGTWYRFFKDAECTPGLGLETTECREKEDLIRKDDGSHEFKGAGTYYKIQFNAISQCKKGKNFCTEVLQVWKIAYHYSDKNCSVMTHVETFYEFGCK
jgi:hypothetical protein